MKTDYLILWVDDDMESVVEDQNAVKDFLETKGINTNLRSFESKGDGDDIHGRIKGVIEDPELDLIVVDYRMEGIDGKKLIELIRESDHVFLPVIFYSSSPMAELLEAVHQAKLDGVYLATRDGVRNKIELVVNSLLTKEQTSKRTRGLLMEGISEIDANFKGVLSKIWVKLDDNQKETLFSYAREKRNDALSAAQKQIDAFPASKEEFWEHANEKFSSQDYDTGTRWRILKRGLELISCGDDELATFIELLNRQGGEKSLITLRNHYAHRTRAQIEQEHSESRCIEIRRELRRQTANITLLLAGD